MEVSSFVIGLVVAFTIINLLLIFRLYQLIQMFKSQIDILNARSLSYESVYIKDRNAEQKDLDGFKNQILNEIEVKNTEFFVDTLDSIDKKINETKFLKNGKKETRKIS